MGGGIPSMASMMKQNQLGFVMVVVLIILGLSSFLVINILQSVALQWKMIANFQSYGDDFTRANNTLQQAEKNISLHQVPCLVTVEQNPLQVKPCRSSHGRYIVEEYERFKCVSNSPPQPTPWGSDVIYFRVTAQGKHLKGKQWGATAVQSYFGVLVPSDTPCHHVTGPYPLGRRSYRIIEALALHRLIG